MNLLIKENTCYVLLHFEQVFNNLFLDNSINIFNSDPLESVKGIYQKSLTQFTVFKIKKEIDSLVNQGGTWTFVFDLNRIKYIGGNDLIEFERLLDLLTYYNNRWLLINVENGIEIKGRGSVNKILMSSIDAFNEEDCSSYCMNLEIIFKEEMEKYLQNCAYQYQKKSISSRVYLSKYIDIKKMMENIPFFCLCMYKLATVLCDYRVLNIDNYLDNKGTSIFIHTMSSAVMGSILAQLFCLDLVIVDHLGPYNKLYVDDLAATIDRHKRYIVVSDVVCLGSELKVAKTILDVLGIQYECCAAMVDIKTTSGIEDDNIFSLYQVTKNHNTLEYYVNTDLDGPNKE